MISSLPNLMAEHWQNTRELPLRRPLALRKEAPVYEVSSRHRLSLALGPHIFWHHFRMVTAQS